MRLGVYKRQTITIPFDAHVHLRRRALLRAVIGSTAQRYWSGVVMPNPKPNGITTVEEMSSYRREICDAVEASGWSRFRPQMTIKVTPNTTPEMVYEAKRAGCSIFKIYPDGITTGSEGGILSYDHLDPFMDAVQDSNGVVCFHPEVPGRDADVFDGLDWEREFVPLVENFLRKFPRLRIVWEHARDADVIAWARTLPSSVRLGVSLTAHHASRSLNDVLGYGARTRGLGNPHYFVKPSLGNVRSMRAVREAALSGNPRFFMGSDTAPHPRVDKECGHSCCGIYAPHALEIFATLFDEGGKIELLDAFTSHFGPLFYELDSPKETIDLVKRETHIPWFYHGTGEPFIWKSQDEPGREYHSPSDLVPLMAGEILPWSVDR